MKNFESSQQQPGKTAEQIIEETVEDLEQGLFDEKEMDDAVAKLEIARVTTLEGSMERRKIDELLQDIADRYGK